MWYLKDYPHDCALWFSDGNPIDYPRGGDGSSSRLIVSNLGFLDLTEMNLSDLLTIDANGTKLAPQVLNGSAASKHSNNAASPVALWLSLCPGGTFALGVVLPRDHGCALSRLECVSGSLKPMLEISDSDIRFIREMIQQRYIPYQNIPGAPGKTDDEIRALGARLFPFTSYSFELALCVYDWTTASFARMVILRIFQYTGVGEPPYPLDQPSIAQQIWESDWENFYTPRNKDYMRSFMMQPAQSVANVQQQLASVAPRLQQLCDTQNRVLSAAVQSLPRTSVISKPQLYSGQLDICQLGLDHFAIEFLECSLNSGPIDKELAMDFKAAMDQYIVPGQSITTKMVWSFADNLEDAIHYSNGIILIANPPNGSMVWENLAYITPLSDDPSKIEYTFMPGTQFVVQSVDYMDVGGNQVVVIELQPKLPRQEDGRIDEHTVKTLKKPFTRTEIASHLQTMWASSNKNVARVQRFKHSHKNSGRRCICTRNLRQEAVQQGEFFSNKRRLQCIVIVLAIWLVSCCTFGHIF